MTQMLELTKDVIEKGTKIGQVSWTGSTYSASRLSSPTGDNFRVGFGFPSEAKALEWVRQGTQYEIV